MKVRGGEAYWKKEKNIKNISQHLNKVTTIQQRTLEIIVLIMGGLGNIKADYNIIIEAIDELSSNQSGEIEVLDYLVKLKKMIIEMQKRDEVLNVLIENYNDLTDAVHSIDNKILENFISLENSTKENTKYIQESNANIHELSLIVERVHNEHKDIKRELEQYLQSNSSKFIVENTKLKQFFIGKFKKTNFALAAIGLLTIINIFILVYQIF